MSCPTTTMHNSNNQDMTGTFKISHDKVLIQDHKVSRAKESGKRTWGPQRIIRALSIGADVYPFGINPPWALATCVTTFLDLAHHASWAHDTHVSLTLESQKPYIFLGGLSQCTSTCQLVSAHLHNSLCPASLMSSHHQLPLFGPSSIQIVQTCLQDANKNIYLARNNFWFCSHYLQNFAGRGYDLSMNRLKLLSALWKRPGVSFGTMAHNWEKKLWWWGCLRRNGMCCTTLLRGRS